MCWSTTVETGVLFIRKGVAYYKTGLHGILFISTVDPFQPPRATVHPPSTSSSLHLRTVHPRAPVHPASTARSSTGYCSTSPLHGGPVHHRSTGYCSSSPPPDTVQPALHRLQLNQPSTGSCSSSPPRGHVHPLARSIRVLFIQRQQPLLRRGPVHPPPTRNCSSNPPNNAQCSSRGSGFAASVSSSSEGIARSGSVNSHRSIARVL